MSEGEIGIILLVGIGIISSLLAHAIIKNLTKACILSSVSASMIFCIAAEIHKPDPLILIAFFMGVIYCSIISIIIGWLFNLIRKRNSKDIPNKDNEI